MSLFAPFVRSLLDHTLQPLQLQEREVPAWAAKREGQRAGQVLGLSSRCWRGPKVRHMRLSLLHSESVFEAFNLLVIPYPDSGAPIFGTELLAFSGKPHLAVIDFQDLRKDCPSWQRRWIDPLEAKAEAHLAMATPRDEMPEWTEAFFSRLCFHRKPVGEELERCGKVFDTYLQHYVSALSAAETIEDPAELEAMRLAHQRYHDDHLQNEPALRTLGRIYGEEWSARYARDFLFDGGSQSVEQLALAPA